MKRLIGLLVVAFLIGGCSHLRKGIMAVQGNPYTNDPEQMSRGRVVYASNCARCHGVSGHGDGVDSKSFSSVPPDFTDNDYDKSLGLIAANIKYGKRKDMPAFKDVLSKKEIWDVSRYVHAMNPSR